MDGQGAECGEALVKVREAHGGGFYSVARDGQLDCLVCQGSPRVGSATLIAADGGTIRAVRKTISGVSTAAQHPDVSRMFLGRPPWHIPCGKPVCAGCCDRLRRH